MWFAAVTQALFSLAIGYGTIITMASYNDFRSNICLYAIIITMGDCITSFLSGITTFSILGHLADLLKVDLPEVVHGGGSSLAFISFPDVLARFPWASQVSIEGWHGIVINNRHNIILLLRTLTTTSTV